jgi:hypothetical protein
MKHRRSQINLGTMLLFVACCAVLMVNLKILADHQADLRHIWGNLTGWHATAHAPTPLRWSEPTKMTPGTREELMP